MHPAADRLRALRDQLRTGAVDPELARDVADRLDRYLEGACGGVTLGEVFEVDPEQSERPWWVQEGVAARNAALCDFAREACEELDSRELAREVARAAERYIASGWRHDRERDEPPPRIASTPRAHLWRALKATDGRIPASEKQIRRILEADMRPGV